MKTIFLSTWPLGFVAMSYIWDIRGVIIKSPWNTSQIVFSGCSLCIVALWAVKSVVRNRNNDLWLLLYNYKGLSFMWRAGVTCSCCWMLLASKARVLPGRQWGICTHECLCEIKRRGQNTHPQPSLAKEVLWFADTAHEADMEQPLVLAAAQLAW